MTSFFFFMPALLLSGFSFPIRNMPVPVQYLTYLNPLRYFMEIVRGMFLKGVGIDGPVAADPGAACCSALRSSASAPSASTSASTNFG